MSKETWKPYKNTPYMVSNRGRVRREEKILKERLNPAGYSYANLSYEGKSEQPAVHEMVLDAFNVPRPKGVEDPIVKHKNNKKADNNLDNLEWGDIADNTQEAYDDGLVEDKGANNPESKDESSKPEPESDTKSKGFKHDKTGDQDKQDSEEYEEDPVIPEGWQKKLPPRTYDEDGAEEKPVNEAPEGWRIQR